MPEAQISRTEHGGAAASDGWFVLNVGDMAGEQQAPFGRWFDFEGGAEFSDFGINIHVLMPGEANGLYHEESAQEDFLVLRGECLLIVEERERRLKAWDFVHCPGGTRHIFVGAGDGPCAILMIGARGAHHTVHYPVSDVAARHGASVDRATDVPRDAYEGRRGARTRARISWPL